jgi:hypothetical protein
MTQNIAEIELWEAEPDIEDMIDAEIEQEVSGYAAVVKERYQEHLRWCEIADAGGMCRSCLIRRMATDEDLGYGAGYCSHCMDLALEQMGGR